jgi:hypothetical protein
MIFLARFILKGPSQAALVAAALAILGLLLPPAAWLSGAAIGLVTLVNGHRAGLLLTAYATVGAAVFGGIIFSVPLVALYFALLVWLPVWAFAVVLKQTVSLALSLQLLTMVSLAGILVLYLLFPDFGEYWREPLNTMIQQLLNSNSGFSEAHLKLVEEQVIRILPGLFASSFMVGAMLSLFLARWWQAVLYNPGGFGKEFRALNLGQVSAVVALLIMLTAVVFASDTLNAMLLVVFVLYLNQGIAVLHAVFMRRQLNKAWLYLVYGLMFFIPQVVVLLAMAGLADTWIDFRRRLIA